MSIKNGIKNQISNMRYPTGKVNIPKKLWNNSRVTGMKNNNISNINIPAIGTIHDFLLTGRNNKTNGSKAKYRYEISVNSPFWFSCIDKL